MSRTLTLTMSDEVADLLRDLRPFFGTTDDAGTFSKVFAVAKVAADHSRPVDGKRCIVLQRDGDVPLAVILSDT